MRTIQREIVSALIFSKEGKLLQGLQDPHGGGVYPGCWGIIGGGVEAGESQREALNREVLEESGIDISPYPAERIGEATGGAEKTLRDTGERVFCEMMFYAYKIVIADKGADAILVTLDHEHTDFRWSLLSELKDMKLTPPSVELFRKLGYLK